MAFLVSLVIKSSYDSLSDAGCRNHQVPIMAVYFSLRRKVIKYLLLIRIRPDIYLQLSRIAHIILRF